MATMEQPREYVVIRMMVGLHSRLARKPVPTAVGSTPFQMIRTRTMPSMPNACTARPETLPPPSATLTVSPMESVSRARLEVRTFAYVALRMPRMHTTLDMHAPMIKVMPLVFSTNRLNTAATTITTIAMTRNSVLRKVLAPSRMMPAISCISSVPSGSFRMRAYWKKI